MFIGIFILFVALLAIYAMHKAIDIMDDEINCEPSDGHCCDDDTCCTKPTRGDKWLN